MSRQLPPRPSLRQLKVQAKDLLKSHRAADPQVSERIRAHLPRLADAPEEAIPDADFTLQEAQHVIAAEYGFKNWNVLQAVVEIDFKILTHLPANAVHTLLREVSQKDLVTALKGAEADVSETLLDNMSERVRAFLEAEIDFVDDVNPEVVEDARRRILLQTVQLVDKGFFEWPSANGSTPEERRYAPHIHISPHVLELTRRPLEELAPDELAQMWKEMAQQARREGILSLEQVCEEVENTFIREALYLAVDGTEPDLIRDALTARSQHALLRHKETHDLMTVEGLMCILSGDNPGIIRYKLETLYRTEASNKESGPREIAVDELHTRLRQTPFSQMDFDQVSDFLTDMGILARNRDIDAFKELVAAVDDALLRCGLELMLDRIPAGQIRESLETQRREDLRQAEIRHRMVIAGIGAVQRGDDPDIVADKVREIAA